MYTVASVTSRLTPSDASELSSSRFVDRLELWNAVTRQFNPPTNPRPKKLHIQDPQAATPATLYPQ